jgi:hypothetical protein
VINDESSAALSAVKNAANPARINDRMTAGPAIPAATPISTKIPAPIIAPILTAAASHTPSVRFSWFTIHLNVASVRPSIYDLLNAPVPVRSGYPVHPSENSLHEYGWKILKSHTFMKSVMTKNARAYAHTSNVMVHPIGAIRTP